MGQEKNTALGSIGSILWGFDMLLEVLEKTREKYGIEELNDDDPNQKLSHLATCVDHAHELLSKYYELTDKTEAYIVAMTLDPRQKHYYFYTHWDKVHHNGVKKKTQALYREFRVEDAGTSLSTDSQPSTKKRKVDDFDINAFRFGGGGGDVQDELERYLKTPKEVLPTDEANSAFDVLAWWRANELVYPTLARMAFELFSIPSMSAEVERVFSR
jgi:hAT family C-terminal dimerisation region